MALTIEPTVVSDGHGAGLGAARFRRRVAFMQALREKTRLSEWCVVGIAGWCLSGGRLAASVASLCWCRPACQLAAMRRPLPPQGPEEEVHSQSLTDKRDMALASAADLNPLGQDDTRADNRLFLKRSKCPNRRATTYIPSQNVDHRGACAAPAPSAVVLVGGNEADGIVHGRIQVGAAAARASTVGFPPHRHRDVLPTQHRVAERGTANTSQDATGWTEPDPTRDAA